MKFFGFIPCRVNSKRLPKKLLMKVNGYPLFTHVYFNAKNSMLDEVYVCSSDREILEVCKSLKIPFVKTTLNHKSGTDRCAEAARILNVNQNNVVVNIQGDEPLLKSNHLNLLIKNFKENENLDILTFHKKEFTYKDYDSTKLVLGDKNKVIYISREDLPYSKNKVKRNIHIGVFAFKNKTLQNISSTKQTKLEKVENIELIRSIEKNYNIHSVELKSNIFGIDKLEEFTRLETIMKKDTSYIKKVNKFYCDN